MGQCLTIERKANNAKYSRFKRGRSMSHYLTLKKIGQAVAYYPNLTKKLGNVNASILLSQFIYWHDKTEHLLGVYKTQSEIQAETDPVP